MVNFHLAKTADESVILRSSDDEDLSERMFTEVLGVYTQPPFLLHTLEGHDASEAFESIRLLMSRIDGIEYPEWLPSELEELLVSKVGLGEEPPNQPAGAGG